jgi:hypothetical protein
MAMIDKSLLRRVYENSLPFLVHVISGLLCFAMIMMATLAIHYMGNLFLKFTDGSMLPLLFHYLELVLICMDAVFLFAILIRSSFFLLRRQWAD